MNALKFALAHNSKAIAMYGIFAKLDWQSKYHSEVNTKFKLPGPWWIREIGWITTEPFYYQVTANFFLDGAVKIVLAWLLKNKVLTQWERIARSGGWRVVCCPAASARAKRKEDLSAPRRSRWFFIFKESASPACDLSRASNEKFFQFRERKLLKWGQKNLICSLSISLQPRKERERS